LASQNAIGLEQLEWGTGNENANFFRLIVNNAYNCFQDEYRYLNLFSFSSHIPYALFFTLPKQS